MSGAGHEWDVCARCLCEWNIIQPLYRCLGPIKGLKATYDVQNEPPQPSHLTSLAILSSSSLPDTPATLSIVSLSQPSFSHDFLPLSSFPTATPCEEVEMKEEHG